MNYVVQLIPSSMLVNALMHNCFIRLTAANEGLFVSPGAGWVTSAPNIMMGSLENNVLNRKYMIAVSINSRYGCCTKLHYVGKLASNDGYTCTTIPEK